MRCAPARRSSYGRGPGAQLPDFFLEILLPRVHFYNRVHFFTAVFNMLKMILYTSYWLPNTNFLILRLNLTDFFWKIRASRTHLRASESKKVAQ